MGRKVASAAAAMLAVVVSVVLVGGQVGTGGFLWWGNHEPIYIYGNDGFTVANGVFSGSGTQDDPYIIEGWRIDRPDADYGIYIDHTTAYFVIRDCVVEGTRQAGVYFNTVRNGRVETTQIGLSDTAVYLLDSSNNRFERNVFAESRYGVVTAATSHDNVIDNNSFIDNGLNGNDPYRRNLWTCNGVGNYWSDYTGQDSNSDGIGDIPYYRLNDTCPLMSPPVDWTRVAPAGLSYAGNQVAPDGSLVVSSDTPISLSAMDPGSGLAQIQYSIDGGPWTVYSSPIFLTGDDGPRKLSFYGVDQLGNKEPQRSVSFLLDNHPPITQITVGDPKYQDSRGTWVTSKSQISLDLTQQSSYGTTRTFYRIDGRNWQRYVGPFTLTGADGLHQISYYSQNASGVTEDLQTMVLIKDDVPPSTHGGQASTTGSGSGIQVNVGPSTEPTPPVEEPPVETPTVQDQGTTTSEQTPPATVNESPVQTDSETGVQTPSGTT